MKIYKHQFKNKSGLTLAIAIAQKEVGDLANQSSFVQLGKTNQAEIPTTDDFSMSITFTLDELAELLNYARKQGFLNG